MPKKPKFTMDKLSLHTRLKSVFLCAVCLPLVTSMHLSVFAHPRTDLRPDARKVELYAPKLADTPPIDPPIEWTHRVRHPRMKRAHRRPLMADMENTTAIPPVSSHHQTANMHTPDKTLTSALPYLHSTQAEDKHEPDSPITASHKSDQEYTRHVSTVTSTPETVPLHQSVSRASDSSEQSNQPTHQARLTTARDSVTTPITNSLTGTDLEPQYTQSPVNNVNDVTSSMYVDVSKGVDVTNTSTSAPRLEHNNRQETSHKAEQFASTPSSSMVLANATAATQITDERPQINADSGGDENQLITSRHYTHRSQITSAHPLDATVNVNRLTESTLEGAQNPTSTASPIDHDVSEGFPGGQIVNTGATEAATEPSALEGDIENPETTEKHSETNDATSPVKIGVKSDTVNRQITTTGLLENPSVVTTPPNDSLQVTQIINETESITTPQSEDSMSGEGSREKLPTHTTEMSSLDPRIDTEVLQTTPRISDIISTDSAQVSVVINNKISFTPPTTTMGSLPRNETGYTSENVTQISVSRKKTGELTTVIESNTSFTTDTSNSDLSRNDQGVETTDQRMATESVLETTESEPLVTTETPTMYVTSARSDLSREHNHSMSTNSTRMPSLMDTTQSVIITSDNTGDETSSPMLTMAEERLTTPLHVHVTDSVTEPTKSFNNSNILGTIENAKNLSMLSSTMPPHSSMYTPTESVRDYAAHWDKLWLFILISCCVLAATLLIFLLALVIFFATRRKTPKKRAPYYYHPRKNHPFTDSDLMYSTEVGNTSESEEMTFGTFGKTRGRDRVMLSMSGSNEKIMHPFVAPGVDFIRIKSNPLRTNGTKAEYV